MRFNSAQLLKLPGSLVELTGGDRVVIREFKTEDAWGCIFSTHCGREVFASTSEMSAAPHGISRVIHWPDEFDSGKRLEFCLSEFGKYPKIQTVYMRDPETKHKTLIEGRYSLPEFAYLRRNRWLFTEKVDGTNIRVIYDGSEVHFAGRTDRSEIPRDLAEALHDLFPAQRFSGMPSMALFGEGYGPRIQKNGHLYRDDPGFVLFDVKIGGFWLERRTLVQFASENGIDLVPTVGVGSLDKMVRLVREGLTSTWGDFQAEGIVATPREQLFNRKGERIITKLKTRDFAR